MKEKLSVLAILVCCISLFSGCNDHQKKVNKTVEIPQALQNFISTKYPQATVLSSIRKEGHRSGYKRQRH